MTSSPGRVATVAPVDGRGSARRPPLAAALAVAGQASAQGRPGAGGFGPPGGFAPPSGGSGKKKAPKKPEEETHAASNAEAQQSLQTQEPQLPQNPNELPKEMKDAHRHRLLPRAGEGHEHDDASARFYGLCPCPSTRS